MTCGISSAFTTHPGSVGISVITLAELEFGVEKSQHSEKNRIALSLQTKLVTNNIKEFKRIEGLITEDWST